MAARIRKGDKVVVLSGRDKGRSGEVIEMRRTDGLGMHVSVSPDPSTGGPVFAVEVVQLDPATGDWLHDAEPVTGAQTYPTRDEWQSAIATLRRTGKLPSHFS